MKPKKRQKLCHNCEGEVDVDVIVCPFCAADLREEKPEQQAPYNPASSVRGLNRQQTSQSLYPPPSQRAVEEPSSVDEVSALVNAEEDGSGKTKNLFVPTVLFTLGVQLCVFGLLMLLFSQKGVIMLKWDARFWFAYVFVSVPFLVFGYRALSRL